MKEVLFLVHRLPFPPDKGDKIRSYHLFKHLVKHYGVHLGCFIDSDHDERYRSEVESDCKSSKICRLDPLQGRLKSASALLTGKPLSWPYYFDNDLMRWVEKTLRTRNISSIVCYSSPMSQYVMNATGVDRRIMDFVDVDSDKWQQYAANKSIPARWIYAREARRLLRFERRVATEFDASVFVSPNEVQLFNSLAPESSAKHFAVANGVACDFFDPDLEHSRPFADEAAAIVFTGTMDYWANVDAVTWFSKEVFPFVREANPTAEFWIVGASPTEDVRALGSLEGVNVTGRVDDVRPFLRHAAVVVAPLRIARGIQNKVLEALAMGRSVVCTPQAAAGLHEFDGWPVSVVTDARAFADRVISLAGSDASQADGHGARQYVLDHYSWDHNLDAFESIHNGFQR